MSKIKVLLCSDSPSYSQRLAAAFEEENNSFRVVGTTVLQELAEAALRTQTDIVLIKLDDVHILPSIVNLKNEYPFILPIIIVQENIFNTYDLINNGIYGYLPLWLFPRQIVNAVELIALAGVMCLPRLNAQTINENSQRENYNLNILTSREREVLTFLSKSFSNKEIADSLCLSVSTVKTHFRNVFKKLNVRNRTEAAAIILGSDLIAKK